VQIRKAALVVLVGVVAAVFAVGASRTKPLIADSDEGKKVVMRDDCDPDDPAWAPVGCALRDGDVTFAEFNGELSSPLSLSVIGHQAWRNDPSYLKIETDDEVRVRNRGGRPHTFTKVAQFGGGRIPPLNQGLIPAPECATAPAVPPGGSTEITGLAAGNHRFQCCFHPWMRAIVKVQPEDEDDDDDSISSAGSGGN
jgi:plastocyanin